MRPASDDLRAAVRRGHQRTAVVYTVGRAGNRTGVLPVSAGSVSFDLSNASGARSGTVRVPGYAWAPVDETDPLAPFGQSLDVVFDYGPLGEVDVGRFPIVAAQVPRPGGLVEVTIGDPAVYVDRYVLEGWGRSYGKSALTTGAIMALVNDAVSAQYDRNDIPGALIGGDGYAVTTGTSRWQAALDLADMEDCDLWFGDDGRLNVASRYKTTQPVDVLDVGEGGVILTMTTGVDILTAYNRVVVLLEPENSDKPSYRAVQSLTSGPMRYGGPAGRLPLVVPVRRRRASQSSADKLAARMFRRQVGVARRVQLSTIPMPWLEVADTVTVAGPLGHETAVVESITLPLTPDEPSTITTREDMEQTIGPFRRDVPEFLGVDR